MTDILATPEATQLFVTINGESKVLSGKLVAQKDSTFVVQLDENHTTLEGSAVLFFTSSERERALTTITEFSDGKVTCEEGVHISPDKRAFPRLFAGINVQYREVSSEESEAWLKDELVLDDWFLTDDFMNFSVTGLAFEGAASCKEGALLALRISVGQDTEEWKAIAKSIRVTPLADYEQEPLRDGSKTVAKIAVAFETVPDPCVEALTELTNRVLDNTV